MKRLFALIILTVTLSVCAFAVKPAENLLTGTKDALNFDGASGSYFTNTNTQYVSYINFSVVSDPTGSGRGNMFKVDSDLNSISNYFGRDTYVYYSLKRDFANSVSRPVFMYFETYGQKQVGFWLGNASSPHLGTLTSGWHTVSRANTDIFTGNLAFLRIQYATRASDCSASQYFDNVAVYPYYKIDYVASYPDGTNGVTTTKYFFDASKLKVAANGTVTGFPEKYSIEDVEISFAGYNHVGWTTQKGSTAKVTSVNLSGSDITLYPVWEKKTEFHPVNVTVWLDEDKTSKLDKVYNSDDVLVLPVYSDVLQYMPQGKFLKGFNVNGKVYEPGKSITVPETTKLEIFAVYEKPEHSDFGELVLFEGFGSIPAGTYLCEASSYTSNVIYPAYINPSWISNNKQFNFRYGDSMNDLVIVDDGKGGNVLKSVKAKATAYWPQMYLFNSGKLPDGLYTVVVDFIIPQSEVANFNTSNLRVYYDGKAASYVQSGINTSGNADKTMTLTCAVSVAADSDVTGIPKIQIFSYSPTQSEHSYYYVDNIAIYHKKAVANVKLSDTVTKKIFFVPGETITLPACYEFHEIIADGYEFTGFKKGTSIFSEGSEYVTSVDETSISFTAEYKKIDYSLKFETATFNGTIGEITVFDGDEITLPDSGLYHPSLTLSGWKIKGQDKVYSKGEKFTFDYDFVKSYIDGTDRLVFTPVYEGKDYVSYGFKKEVTFADKTPTFATLVEIADKLYYGVRNRTSPNASDAERLADMVSKGITSQYTDLTASVTYNDAAKVLANALPGKFYKELCFNVNVSGNDEAKKLVRAGIFNEGIDFASKISYSELALAVSKLCNEDKRSVENKRTLYFLGDSLTQAYGPTSSMKGWPEYIHEYLGNNLELVNYGIAGINTGTYFVYGHSTGSDVKYLELMKNLKKGDYVVIALGTNDSTLWDRGNMTQNESRENYYRLISEIRAQGGIPMLVCPVGRNKTDTDGNYIESDPEIIKVMQSVNEIYGLDVPILNFKDISFDILSSMTKQERLKFYIDEVHYQELGARIVAGWFSELVLSCDDVKLFALGNHFLKEESANYITVNIGNKVSASNVRYTEIDGCQNIINDDNGTLSFGNNGSNMLLEVVEKTVDGEVVKTEYYYLNSLDGTSTILDMDSFTNNLSDYSVRTKSPSGLRFKANFSSRVKKMKAGFEIVEYGFIITRNDLLSKSGAQLNFDFDKYVSGVAYNKLDGTDLVFDRPSDDKLVFSGVIVNLPKENYATKLVCKTYTKISVNGEMFTVYGEPMVASLYEIAKTSLGEDLSSEERIILEEIVRDAESKDLDLEVDDLYD